MKLYHYTKGNRLNSIFTDGVIITEGKGELYATRPFTDYVWLTEKGRYPKTALPCIGFMPETNLMAHVGRNAPYIDYDKLSIVTGGIFRFGFDSSDTRFKKWWFSAERKQIQHNIYWRHMESVANKVGDDVRSFWIALDDVALESCSLDTLENGTWKSILSSFSLSTASNTDLSVIEALKCRSRTACAQYGFPALRKKLAA